MKNAMSATWLLAVLAVFTMSSCSKSVPNNSATPVTGVSVTTSIISGTWAITSWIQRTEDKTSKFNGYMFTFLKGGSLQAANSGAVTSGTWIYTPSSVGYYGSSPSKASLSLSLGNAEPLSRLTRIWNIDSAKTTSSQLFLINPEPNDDERVTFSKQ